MIFCLEAPLVDIGSWRGQGELECVALATRMWLRGFCVLKENPKVSASFYKDYVESGTRSCLGRASSGTQDPALSGSAWESHSGELVSLKGSLRKSKDKIRLQEDSSKDGMQLMLLAWVWKSPFSLLANVIQKHLPSCSSSYIIDNL